MAKNPIILKQDFFFLLGGTSSGSCAQGFGVCCVCKRHFFLFCEFVNTIFRKKVFSIITILTSLISK
jgi:hypothetical protein